jgi:nucleoside-diphosphate-sugar epimerase
MSLILITGSSGFLGKSLLHQFAIHKFKILTIGRNHKNHILCDLGLEVPIINTENIELVVHAAGKAHFLPKTEAEKKAFYDVNLRGTHNLLKALENLSHLPKYFVFISSVAVYGLANGTNINEEFALQAKDPYGLSKIHAEQLITDWCQVNDVICTVLRLPLLVGINPPGNLGLMVKGIQKGFYFNIGGGNAKKSMVLADDVAKFIPKIAKLGGTYNLTDGEHPSFKDLSLVISNKKIYNLPLTLAKTFGFLGDIIGEHAPINSFMVKKITSELTFDDSKARALGWKPQSVLKYLKNIF